MEQEVIRDIEETFKTLREINMKLNPKKCTFRMREGMFMWYKVNAEGLKVCPNKVQAVLSLPSPKCLKDVQRLNGKLASLNRFIEVVYVNRTERERGINHLPGGCKGSYQCSPNDGKGRETSTHLLRQPCIIRSENQLHSNGEADTCSDGSSCIDGSGAGLILTNPEGMEFTYALRFKFDATNNEAAYEALIAGLRIAEQMGRREQKSRRAKQDGIYQFCPPKQTSTCRGAQRKSIDEEEVLAVVEEGGHTWMTPIHEYLMEEILPEEKRKARTVRRKADRYVMTNEILYKKSFLRPWLQCVGPLQANYVLREINEGSCSMHAGLRSVVVKALRSGYYWPTMHADAMKLMRECNSCQVHRPVPRNSEQNLNPITSPWPF
ncbi:reverse transcriptase domain-containing protein [Tanacetum coccineum]